MQPDRTINASISTRILDKCNKSFIFIGGLFLIAAIGGCQMGGTADLQNNLISANLEGEHITRAFVPANSDATPSDWSYGAFISSDLEESRKLLQLLPYPERIETVVILAPTKHQTESFDTFTYDSAGDQTKIHATFDQDVINALSSLNNVKNLGAIGEKSYWRNGLLDQISTQFPRAKLVPISINREIDEWKLQSLAFVLKTNLPEKSLVLAVADIKSENENPLVKDYQSSFIESTLQNPTRSRFAALTTEATPQLQVLSHYLTYMQAQKAQMRFGSAYQAFYLKDDTEPATTAETPVYLVSFGDMMLGRYVQTLMGRNGQDFPFSLIDESYLKMNDILMANLEGPIAKNAIQTSKTIAFRFLPDVVPLIKKYHFDALSLANNHAIDMGAQGYTDSVELLTEAGITNFGDPRQLTDDTVAKIIKNGQKLAFIGIEEVVYKIDDKKTIETIKNLTAEGYKVIVMPHWGIEYVHKPNQRQRDLAHAMIDAGAFAIIGHHPHVVQTYETYNGHPIFYSLGNAIFDQYWSQDTQIGLSVALQFTSDQIDITFLPIRIDFSRPRLMNDQERASFMEEFIGYGVHTDEEKQALKTGKITIYPLSE